MMKKNLSKTVCSFFAAFTLLLSPHAVFAADILSEPVPVQKDTLLILAGVVVVLAVAAVFTIRAIKKRNAE